MSVPLSCIITCFCLEKYIWDCLKTAFTQQYDGPVQYIVIDDASTDQSRRVIEEAIAQFAPELDVLFLSNEKNLGIAASTDLGVVHAKYDHIVLMDGDDCFPEDRLQKTGEILSRHPDAMMIMGSMIHMDECGVLGDVQGYSALRRYEELPELYALNTADEKFSDYMGISGIKLNAYGTALSFSKKLHDLFGPLSPPDAHSRPSQDGPIEIRALLAGKVIGTKSIFSHYRSHRTNLSNYSYGVHFTGLKLKELAWTRKQGMYSAIMTRCLQDVATARAHGLTDWNEEQLALLEKKLSNALQAHALRTAWWDLPWTRRFARIARASCRTSFPFRDLVWGWSRLAPLNLHILIKLVKNSLNRE